MNLKTLRQFVILFGAFFLVWFALSRIEFIKPERTEKLSKQKEEILGKLFIDQVLSQHDTCRIDTVVQTIQNLMYHLCRSNNIDTQSIRLHLIHHSEVNAYAFPGRHIVLHSELVQYCNNPGELAAVLAHEVAHIEKNHVMKKLTREVGIVLITAVISGGNNGEIVGEMSIIDSGARTASGKTGEDSKLIVVTKNSFAEILDSDPAIAAKILMTLLRIINRRLRVTDKKFEQ